jgi:heat shock protein HtpX
MATLYSLREKNIRKTWILMALFLIFVITLGWVFGQVYNNPIIFYTLTILSILMSWLSYFYSDKMVIAMTGAKEVSRENYRELYNIVENLCITAGLPMPKIYIINDPQPNAFATGRNPKNSAIAVTSGLLEILDRSELEGVIAHELSHIGNYDMLVSTIAVTLYGIVAMISDMFLRMSFYLNRSRDNRQSPIFMIIAMVGAILAPLAALLIQLAISRKREFLADASGALLTRYPEGLASALEKIGRYNRPMRNVSTATAHLFFDDPLKSNKNLSSRILNLFQTHPPIEQRIKALRGIEM